MQMTISLSAPIVASRHIEIRLNPKAKKAL